MGRLRHFHRNVGWWALVRTFAVAVLFIVIGIGLLLQRAQPLALVSALVAIAVPRVLLGWLVDHFERSVLVLRWMGIGIVGGAVVSPLWKDWVDTDASWFLPPVVFLAMLYLAAYFWIMSDRRIVRQ